MLNWALEEVKLKDNQFGRAKGCSSSHLLISVWQKILSDLEDCRTKAFNRMRFQECLSSFARHGASNQVLKLGGTFLHERTMSVRVGSTWSKPRPVSGGVPQGSILGVLLVNMTTNYLEDDKNAIGLPNSRETTTEHETTEADKMAISPSCSESSLSPDDTSFAQSTSVSGTADFTPEITPFRGASGASFVFLNNARNVRRSLYGAADLTMIRDRTIPEEPNPTTSAVWRPREAELHKYVDDSIIDSKLDMETVTAVTDEAGLTIKLKYAIASQNSL